MNVAFVDLPGLLIYFDTSTQEAHNWKTQCCEVITFRLKILALKDFDLYAHGSFFSEFSHQVETYTSK